MARFENDVEEVDFAPGDVLFRQGETGTFFFIIQLGQVEIYRDVNGKVSTLATLGPTDSVGEFAAIDKKPRSASARAMTPVKAVKISEQAYAHLLSELPEWSVSVLTALVARLRSANEVILQYQIRDGRLTD